LLRDCLIAVLFATARQLQLSCGRNIDYVSEAESLIVGREKITNIFGYWPSFHDAEVLEFHLWRGNVDPDVKAYVFPVLTVKIHLWEITSKVDTRGYCVLRHRTLATLRFHDVDHISMDGFNHQNAILGLSIDMHQRKQGVSQLFKVVFQSAFGMAASFECNRVEVLDASPCDDSGKLIEKSSG